MGGGGGGKRVFNIQLFQSSVFLHRLRVHTMMCLLFGI